MSMTRRRFLSIMGVAGVAAGMGSVAHLSAGLPRWRWDGQALGAATSITLYHPDIAAARRAVDACVDEIARLEDIFSLYKPASELVRLNREGVVAAPSADLLRLMAEAVAWGKRTDGMFDVSVQPLWDLHFRHFTAHPEDQAGPDAKTLAAAVALVDYRAIRIDAEAIAFAKPGMGVTLNGIAQGYITDQVAAILRGYGIGHVLADIGEIAAIGRRGDGEQWSVGLERAPAFKVALEDAGLATSSGLVTRFESSGRFHHIFDPRTGISPRYYDAVSVTAKRATDADALSTALYATPKDRVPALLAAAAPASAWLQTHEGMVETFVA